MPAQTVLLLQVRHQFGDELHVVDGHAGLERIARIPAGLAAPVLFALRVADGEAVAVGDLVHSVTFGPGLTPVAVEDDDQRCTVGNPSGRWSLYVRSMPPERSVWSDVCRA